MQRLAHFVALLLLLVMSAPALACATAVAMTPTEKLCCETMHGRCGEMPGHHCCQVQVRTDTPPLPSAQVQAHLAPFVSIAYFAAWNLAFPVFTPYWTGYDVEHPPPGPRHLSTFVLRI